MKNFFKPLLEKNERKWLEGDAVVADINRKRLSKEEKESLERHEKLIGLGFVEYRDFSDKPNKDGYVQKITCLTKEGMDYRLLGEFWYRGKRFAALFSLLSIPISLIALIVAFVS